MADVAPKLVGGIIQTTERQIIMPKSNRLPPKPPEVIEVAIYRDEY
jgi:hypothetical protein